MVYYWTSSELDMATVARCPVLNWTVRYFGSFSSIIFIVIPDNTCVNRSIVCAKDTGTASVRYYVESHLATLDMAEVHISICELLPECESVHVHAFYGKGAYLVTFPLCLFVFQFVENS